MFKLCIFVIFMIVILITRVPLDTSHDPERFTLGINKVLLYFTQFTLLYYYELKLLESLTEIDWLPRVSDY